MKKFRALYPSRITSLFALAIAVILHFVPVNAQRWVSHPAFDNSPVRIIDSPDATYYLVHQQLYSKSKNAYSSPSTTIFEKRKNTATDAITPLAAKHALHPSPIATAAYSPQGKALVVAYTDGTIDIFDSASGDHRFTELAKGSLPGMAQIRDISFDPATGNPWIATDCGIFTINLSQMMGEPFIFLSRRVNGIAPTSSSLLLLSGGSILESKSLTPTSSGQFTPLPGISNVTTLLPLSGNEAAVIVGTPGGNCELRLLTRNSDGSWTATKLCNDTFQTLADDATILNRFECNFLPNRDGYLLFSKTKLWQLTRSAGDKSATVRSIPMDAAYSPIGSWDAETFHYYSLRGQFRQQPVSMDQNSNPTLQFSASGKEYRPEAPSAFIGNAAAYSPNYGLLINNHGFVPLFEYLGRCEPILLSGYKDGKWTQFSQAYDCNRPRSLDGNQQLINTYNSYRNVFPFANPHGVLVDPINPDRVWMGSMFCGAACMNLADPKADIIRLTAPSDQFAQTPGYRKEFENDQWLGICCLSAPAIDSDNRLWFAQSSLKQINERKDFTLKYIEPDDRRKLYADPTGVEAPVLKTLTVNSQGQCNFWSCGVLPIHNSQNKNKIVIFTNIPSELTILDHNGTLEDSSDDKTRKIERIIDETGISNTFYRVSDWIENPVTGEVYMATLFGAFGFFPDAKVTDLSIQGRRLLPKGKNGVSDLINVGLINKFAFDPSGRLWIGTHNQGLVCCDGDAKTVLAEYNTSNSPLPSNTIVGLCWNPDRNSMMVTTLMGSVELFPEETAPSDAQKSSATIFPTSIEPGYLGELSIRNLPANQDIYILNEKGDRVATFHNLDKCEIRWNLRNDKGERLPSGIYKIEIGRLTTILLPILN